jgi:hypothetical protein
VGYAFPLSKEIAMNTSTDVPDTSAEIPAKGWSIALWTAQVLLALMFGFAGGSKLFTPIADLAKNAEWIRDLPALIRFIGLSEFAGALGMILPAATRIKPGLLIWAAYGLVVVMILATGFHLARREFTFSLVTVFIGAVAGFVAWGRKRKAPITPRSATRPEVPAAPMV